VGQARFALVILLVLLAGKYRDTIQLIPALVGFSMYQVGEIGGWRRVSLGRLLLRPCVHMLGSSCAIRTACPFEPHLCGG
jgi:hypothetical protein